eukprot:TRINITY_DN22796_c3_g1_i1.p1 TRINITY_DN22796_c3_g1~~TRINITY_DN22796_c3_g1_i1.p1  ORF type:complete len:229 (-),score=-1.33 TRINITY_DN22796_c3_g1_i1:470-1156(-)
MFLLKCVIFNQYVTTILNKLLFSTILLSTQYLKQITTLYFSAVAYYLCMANELNTSTPNQCNEKPQIQFKFLKTLVAQFPGRVYFGCAQFYSRKETKVCTNLLCQYGMQFYAVVVVKYISTSAGVKASALIDDVFLYIGDCVIFFLFANVLKSMQYCRTQKFCQIQSLFFFFLGRKNKIRTVFFSRNIQVENNQLQNQNFGENRKSFERQEFPVLRYVLEHLPMILLD